jgi:hypothetical protein
MHVCETSGVLEILAIGFAALLPQCRLIDTLTLYVLNSLVGKNQSLSNFCVQSQIFYSMEFCEVVIVANVPV